MVVMRFLVLSLLICTVLADEIDIGVKRRHKTKKGHVAKDEGTAKTQTTSSDGYTEKVQAFQNLEYKGTISIGNPPQVFEVIMDTGSDILWLPKVGCTSSGPDVQSCLSGQGLYNPKKSQTAIDLRTRFQIQYGTGSAVGDYYLDTMSFGNANDNHVSVGNVTFGAANRMTFSDEGILGLSFAQSEDPTPVFELAVQRGVFTQPIFSVYLADCDGDCENGGQIKLGAVDTEHCQSVIGTAQVVGRTPYWLFALSGISISGRAFNVQSSLRAIVDTGTSIIAGPSQLMQQIATAVGAQQTQGAYLVPCNAQIQIEFTINGQLYTVTSAELILAGIVASSGNQAYCQLAIDGDDQLDFVILGSPFIRAYCLIHNVQTKTISFAPVKPTNNSNSNSNNNNNGVYPIGGSGTTRGSPNNGQGTHGRGGNNNWPFGNSNNWPFDNSDSGPFGNSPFSSGQSPFGSSPWSSSYNSPFGQSSSWPYENQNPFGSSWNSEHSSPWTSSWNMPSNSGFWYFDRPYRK